MNAYEKIRVIRNLNKQTQTEFGDSLGISKATVSNIEKEKVPLPPYIVILLKLLYNVDPEWLMDDTQSDFDKRFYDKTQETDFFVSPILIEKIKALRSPYNGIIEKMVDEFLAAQEAQDKANEEKA